MSFPTTIRLGPAWLLLLSQGAWAQAFSAQVLPPRFESATRAGDVYRDIIEIQNVSNQPARFLVRTADWGLAEDGTAEFEYALAPGSCRPWVGIEAPEVRLVPNATRRFRFEVAVPTGTPDGQCRFAVMIEGEPQVTASGLPVAGRIGVIVYLTIGDGEAKLDVAGTLVQPEQGRDIPFLRIRNSGNAHGRVEGLLDAVDATGRRWILEPAHDPILPGTTRAIALRPGEDPGRDPATPIAYPLAISGNLDWGRQRIPVDTTASR